MRLIVRVEFLGEAFLTGDVQPYTTPHTVRGDQVVQERLPYVGNELRNRIAHTSTRIAHSLVEDTLKGAVMCVTMYRKTCYDPNIIEVNLDEIGKVCGTHYPLVIHFLQ